MYSDVTIAPTIATPAPGRGHAAGGLKAQPPYLAQPPVVGVYHTKIHDIPDSGPLHSRVDRQGIQRSCRASND